MNRFTLLFLLFFSNQVFASVEGKTLICDKDTRGYYFISNNKVEISSINLNELKISSVNHLYELTESTILIKQPFVSVNKEENLTTAIEKAYEEDEEIIIESFLDGKEVSVGVIEYQNELIVLPITEIVSENDFFDYEAKYMGKSHEITPARISQAEKEQVERQAKKVYQILNMKGFSRSEFIIVDGVPYFLEINTVPGMTEESLLPQQAKEASISLSELFDNAIQQALK